MPKLEEFEIEREKWLRGTGPSKLRDCDGSMCCIGFFALACGFEPGDIEDAASMGELADLGSGDVDLLADREIDVAFAEKMKEELGPKVEAAAEAVDESIDTMDADFFEPLYEVNDAKHIDDEYRERVITARFAEKGIKVVFR